LQGTLPFIAIELLITGVPHRVVHDLESLFFVLLFICTHLDGPRKIHNPPLYGGKKESTHSSPMKAWLTMKDIRSLGFLKNGAMIGFEENVLPHISTYFSPLKPHLIKLWRALHPIVSGPSERGTAHSSANPIDIINVFKEALQDQSLISQAKSPASNPLKRAFPGDQVFSADSWDVVPAEGTALDPEIGEFSKRRRTKCMVRRHRDG
jgi:hypothetical protein